MAEQVPVVRPRAMGVGVDQFAENLDNYTAGVERFPTQAGGCLEAVTFFRIDNGQSKAYAASLFRTFLDCAAEDYCEPNQACAYLLSALNLWFPMVPVIKGLMSGMNWTVTEVFYPSARPEEVELAPPMTWRNTLLELAQIVMIFFKNIANINYNEYMGKRVAAIRAFLGNLEDDTVILAFEADKARLFRRVIGGDLALRRRTLEYVLTIRQLNTIFGRMCNYLSGIIAWTEMTYMVFMYEELVLPRSPVLSDPDVAAEVKNLASAIIETLKISHPQFFKILVPQEQQRAVDRNKFPILIEIARLLKERKSISAKNYKGSPNIPVETIERLLAVHRAHPRLASNVYQKHREFLAGTVAVGGDGRGLLNNYEGEA